MAGKIERPTRDALRMLSAGPVALVTTMYGSQPNVMAAAWMLPLSLDPVMAGVAIHPDRLTHSFASRSESLIINIPTIDLLGAVHGAGILSGRDKDKFEALGLELEDASILEAPLVAACVGHIECQVVDRIRLGDHDLFAIEVLAVSAEPEAFSGRWNVEEDAGRLLHHLGADRYAALARAYRAEWEPDEDR